MNLLKNTKSIFLSLWFPLLSVSAIMNRWPNQIFVPFFYLMQIGTKTKIAQNRMDQKCKMPQNKEVNQRRTLIFFFLARVTVHLPFFVRFWARFDQILHGFWWFHDLNSFSWINVKRSSSKTPQILKIERMNPKIIDFETQQIGPFSSKFIHAKWSLGSENEYP